MPINQMLGGQTVFSSNTPCQLPENLVMGFYDPNASFERNLGYLEIVLGSIISRNPGGRFGGGGTAVLVNAAVSYIGYALLVDGLQRIGGNSHCKKYSRI